MFFWVRRVRNPSAQNKELCKKSAQSKERCNVLTFSIMYEKTLKFTKKFYFSHILKTFQHLSSKFQPIWVRFDFFTVK